jgi:membrane protein implicated in regulation of membrane protease activity
MNAQWFFGWWNLIFILPFGLALVYLGLYTLSGVTFGDADADVSGDIHADVDGDLHMEMDADADADIHADVDADTDAGSDFEHPSIDHDAGEGPSQGGHSPAMAALGWMGVGRVPVSIVMMVLFLCWGFIGFSSNYLLWPKLQVPTRLVLMSLPIALVGSVIVTRLVVQLTARFLPTNETYVGRRHELLGMKGEAIYNIDGESGVVCVRDERGDLFQIPCRVYRDQRTIAKGSTVKLVAYNGKEGMFYAVAASETSGQTV